MQKLKVFFFDREVGFLQERDGQLQFQYLEDYYQFYDNAPLSFSLPISQELYSGQKVLSFFGGLLPEGDIRESLARKIGLSVDNDLGLLKNFGGDCAGAVSVGPRSSATRKHLSLEELALHLQQTPLVPLLSIQGKHRLSLAGAQNKLAVIVEDEIDYFLPSSREISTHIIKPAIKGYAGSAHNEYFCLELARSIGFEVPKIQLREIKGIYYLVIERYDRSHIHNQTLRLHQEDLSQALGVLAKNKYEKEGGPSYSDCFKLISEASSQPPSDSLRLLDLITYNFLIGNNDAHAKNFSLLYDIRDFKLYGSRLSPCYDLLSTSIYPNLDDKMSMRLGKEYNYRKIRPSNWQRFAEELGVKPTFIFEKTKELAYKVKIKAKELRDDLQQTYPATVYDLILKEIDSRVRYLYNPC